MLGLSRFLVAATFLGFVGRPARAETYCAAVVSNESVSDLKRDMLAAVKKALPNKNKIDGWPGSAVDMLEIDADQGTMTLKKDMWGSGLALHATLCTTAASCDKAKKFFAEAGANNNLQRYGTSETEFKYVDLTTSYQELLKGRPFSFKTLEFNPESWGSWYALGLAPEEIKGNTSSPKGAKKSETLTGQMHVSFIKVKFGSKDSAHATAVSDAIRGAAKGKELSLKFDTIKCN